ncbi:hypothetical protein L218DRAFT_678191 [Marasmius fiardii PR-910]|nr:hypothetical protein L218DRAFT_678191 [Marasmius fiardii PR-910]
MRAKLLQGSCRLCRRTIRHLHTRSSSSSCSLTRPTSLEFRTIFCIIKRHARYPVSALVGKGLREADLDRPWFSPGSTWYSDEDEEIKDVFEHFPKTMSVSGEAEITRVYHRVMSERMKREMGGGERLCISRCKMLLMTFLRVLFGSLSN